jgi:hypothetical protein
MGIGSILQYVGLSIAGAAVLVQVGLMAYERFKTPAASEA